jgi:MoaA/NifB/PqqE/SkfB family radical SAM enzyme
MRFNRFSPYRHIWLSGDFVSALRRSRRNIMAEAYGLAPPTGPFLAELDVTYRCNARCQMCERWKDQRRDELTLDEYDDLAETFSRMGVYLVSLAGGEPLLRQDILSIIDAFARRGMKVNVCTNGLSLEKEAGNLCRSGVSFVTVSLDGSRESTHDQIRGIPGAYSNILKGISTLLDFPPQRRPGIRVRMTISNRNVGEIDRYYRQWHGRVDDVLFQPVHYCEQAFYTGQEREAFRLDHHRLARELERSSIRDDGYLGRFVSSLSGQGMFPAHRCYAGYLMARIDPWGGVYPCLEQHVRVGSLRNETFRDIWESETFQRARWEIARARTCRCWYNNTALISHYATLLKWASVPWLFSGLRKMRARVNNLTHKG